MEKSLNSEEMTALIKELGGNDGARRFLNSHRVPELKEPKWIYSDGAIHFSVTSDGTTGAEWITRLEKGGFMICASDKKLLSEIKTTNGVITRITVLKGASFNGSERLTYQLFNEGKKRGLKNPTPEVACLIREKFSDKELSAMGLEGIVIMHKPIINAAACVQLHIGNQHLSFYKDTSDSTRWWESSEGFAFSV